MNRLCQRTSRPHAYCTNLLAKLCTESQVSRNHSLTNRHTQKQTQPDTQINTNTHRQTDKHIHTHTHTHTHTHRNTHSYKHKDKQTYPRFLNFSICIQKVEIQSCTMVPMIIVCLTNSLTLKKLKLMPL